jgi:hypothetical protein
VQETQRFQLRFEPLANVFKKYWPLSPACRQITADSGRLHGSAAIDQPRDESISPGRQ